MMFNKAFALLFFYLFFNKAKGAYFSTYYLIETSIGVDTLHCQRFPGKLPVEYETCLTEKACRDQTSTTITPPPENHSIATTTPQPGTHSIPTTTTITPPPGTHSIPTTTTTTPPPGNHSIETTTPPPGNHSIATTTTTTPPPGNHSISTTTPPPGTHSIPTTTTTTPPPGNHSIATTTPPPGTHLIPTTTPPPGPGISTTPSVPESDQCQQFRKELCISGDPHVRTIDGGHLNLHTTCPFVLSKTGEEIPDSEGYLVKAKNKRVIGQKTTIIESVQIEVHNMTIWMNVNGDLFVNELRHDFPYYYYASQESSNPLISLVNNSNVFVLTTPNNIWATFTPKSLSFCMSFGDCSKYFGSKVISGIGGNFNGNCLDDVQSIDGVIYQANETSHCSFADTRMLNC